MTDCEACGRAIVEGHGPGHHVCTRAIDYVDAIIATDHAQDLCEMQSGNVAALRRMLLDAFMRGDGTLL